MGVRSLSEKAESGQYFLPRGRKGANPTKGGRAAMRGSAASRMFSLRFGLSLQALELWSRGEEEDETGGCVGS